ADVDGDGRTELATTVSAWDDSSTRLYRWHNGGLERFWSLGGYGTSLAAGDFDGDGHDDVAIGHCRDGEQQEACGPLQLRKGGAVHVVYGEASASDFGTRNQTLHQGTVGVPGTAETADSFGATLSALDANNDGRDDLAIGNPAEAVGHTTGAGMATLLFGELHGVLDEYGDARGTGWNQGTAHVPGTVEKGDRFAAAVRLLDTDGDTAPELLLGSPGENSGTGGLWALPGRGNGPTAPASYTLTPPAHAPAFGGVLSH
ncbi:MAG: FG-GAP repeat protein, partial [Streptomyces sp.]